MRRRASRASDHAAPLLASLESGTLQAHTLPSQSGYQGSLRVAVLVRALWQRRTENRHSTLTHVPQNP
jgi:hypothetical protein